jgi:hypothetical protein
MLKGTAEKLVWGGKYGYSIFITIEHGERLGREIEGFCDRFQKSMASRANSSKSTSQALGPLGGMHVIRIQSLCY